MTLQLLGIIATMAFVLGLVGVYGIVSYNISQQLREIGIRLALGAKPSEVWRTFVQHALTLTGIGVTVGLGAALGLTRMMESQLFGVRPLDLPVYLGVSCVLTAAAAVAAYIPARRAARVDPLVALRYE
jgi:ABC-type antimicrobial peptide transport system permease subunit